MDEQFNDMGIKHEFSANYTQPNDFVESKNRTLIDMARLMISEYMMLFGWKQSTRHAMHASNRLFCHPSLKNISYGLLTGTKPNVAYFGVFGCK